MPYQADHIPGLQWNMFARHVPFYVFLWFYITEIFVRACQCDLSYIIASQNIYNILHEW